MLKIVQSRTFRYSALAPNSLSYNILIIIPGNPGVIEYYHNFMKSIHSALKDYHIFTIQHLGHSFHDDDSFYTLEDQVNHKIAFFDHIKDEYPTSGKIVLIGHSIGAYMAVKVLSQRSQVFKVIQLFPALENLAETEAGRSLMPIFHPITRNIVSLSASAISTLFFLFPSSTTRFIGYISNQPIEYANITATNLVNFKTVNSCLYLAADEMKVVLDLDDDLTKSFTNSGEKHIIYCGKGDRWCPTSSIMALEARFADLKVYHCDEGVKHAFIIEHSELMAFKVVDWIENL